MVLISVISINDVFAEHTKVTIIPTPGSGTPECEETVEGCFIPKEATVDVGGKVLFSNTDTVAHTFTAGKASEDHSETSEGHSVAFDSSLVITGNSYEWIPTIEGVFPYHCMVHPWMEGTIFVEAIMSNSSGTASPTDTDGDGISDLPDKCPLDPETINGFQDTDGCPDTNPVTTDTDGDGISDSSDSCLTDPETINGFQDTDGCPDVVIIQDSDKDGIVDSDDTCPRSPETFNEYEDEDGCPDNTPVTDTDGDGILDTLDSCITQAETINEFEDEDGCPDKLPIKDSDNDGISDDYDKCPIQAEIRNNYQDTDGCPDEIVSNGDDLVLVYAAIGIGVAGAGTAIGIKLHGKGSGGNAKNTEPDKHDDDQDVSSHVEVRITGGIE